MRTDRVRVCYVIKCNFMICLLCVPSVRINDIHYDRSARDLPTLHEGDTVRMKPFRLADKSWKKTQRLLQDSMTDRTKLRTLMEQCTGATEYI